jgi:hypothetical protein
MLPRERVLAALSFESPDVIPLEYHRSPAGFYEHGERLRKLWERHLDDFGPAGRFELSSPPATCIDGEGRYSELRRDPWGVLWQHLVFGAAGIPIERPLDDWSAWAEFNPPRAPASTGLKFLQERERAASHCRRFFLKSGWISLFECMHALRRFEDVLVDVATDRPEIHRLADRLVDYHLASIRYLTARGVDAIQFGDDFGTQEGLLVSPKTWRSFFKPRYDRLIHAVHDAGKKVFFHSCGYVRALLDDLADLHVDAIWPQLNAYDEHDMANFCRQARIAIALHPDRGQLMIGSAPDAVRRYVHHIAEVFAADQGGSWFYLEVDPGFPYENVVALTEAVASLRTEAACSET